MRDNIRDNLEDFKAAIVRQSRKNNVQTGIIAALTVLIAIASIVGIVFLIKDFFAFCDDDYFNEFEEDDFEEDDFEEE